MLATLRRYLFPTPSPPIESFDYNSLDFTKCAIGGSYALKQLTLAEWPAHDIDIFVATADFDNLVAQFQATIPTAVILLRERVGKAIIYDRICSEQEGVRTELRSPETDTEEFTRIVARTKTFHVDGVTPNLIQFIALTLAPNETLETCLARITDVPACVSFRIVQGQKYFTIPEKGRLPLFHRQVTRSAIATARTAKYEARGYTVS
jgi:hypothetical protein